MKHQKTIKIILFCLLGLILVFIWGNSCLPFSQSTAESSVVEKIVRPILEPIVGKGKVTSTLVRKLAHFCEFAALGAVMGLLLWQHKTPRLYHISYVLFSGISVAVVDEGIQLFANGRSAQVKDVLLDSCGVVAGIMFSRLIIILVREVRK